MSSLRSDGQPLLSTAFIIGPGGVEMPVNEEELGRLKPLLARLKPDPYHDLGFVGYRTRTGVRWESVDARLGC